MSKQQDKKPTAYQFLSRFGSHSNMIVKSLDENKVICKDEFGEYQTDVSRLDDGTADPARWDLNSRRISL